MAGLMAFAFGAMNGIISTCVLYQISSPLIEHGVPFFQAALQYVRKSQLLAVGFRLLLQGGPELDDQALPFAFTFFLIRLFAVVCMIAVVLQSMASAIVRIIRAARAASYLAALCTWRSATNRRGRARLHCVGFFSFLAPYATLVALVMVNEGPPLDSPHISPLSLVCLGLYGSTLWMIVLARDFGVPTATQSQSLLRFRYLVWLRLRTCQRVASSLIHKTQSLMCTAPSRLAFTISEAGHDAVTLATVAISRGGSHVLSWCRRLTSPVLVKCTMMLWVFPSLLESCRRALKTMKSTVKSGARQLLQHWTHIAQHGRMVSLLLAKFALMLWVLPSLVKSWYRRMPKSTMMTAVLLSKCALVLWSSLEWRCRRMVKSTMGALCVESFSQLRTHIARYRRMAALLLSKSALFLWPSVESPCRRMVISTMSTLCVESVARHVFPQWTYIVEIPNFPRLRDLDQPCYPLDFRSLPPTILPPCTCETPPSVPSIPPAVLNPLLPLILAECKCGLLAPIPSDRECHLPIYDMLSAVSPPPSPEFEFEFIDDLRTPSPMSSPLSTSSAYSQEEDSSPERDTIARRRALARRSLVFPSSPRVLSPILEVSSVASSSAPSSAASTASSSAPPSPGGSCSSSCGTASACPSPSSPALRSEIRRVDAFTAREAQAHFLSFSAGLKLPTTGRVAQQEEFQTNAADMGGTSTVYSGTSVRAASSKPLNMLLPGFKPQEKLPAPQNLVVFRSGSSKKGPCRPDCEDIYCGGECVKK